MAENTAALVGRHKKVAFLGIVETSTEKFHRMRKFTAFSKSSNPKEYSRQYVDEAFEQTDVVGFSPSISYTFDLYTNTPVYKEIVSITDGELLGSEAVRNVVIVDLSQPAGETAGQFVAWKKPYSVIPDTEGDSTDAYTYSGTLRTAGESVKGYATSDDNWETLTFTEGEPSPAG